MLRLTKRIDYGILILTALGRGEDTRLSAKEISETFDLSRNMVANILKALSKADLVTAERGVNGGYRLSGPAESIHLLHVIEALERPFSLLACCSEDEAPECSTTTSICSAKPIMFELNTKLRALLDSVSVADFNSPTPCGPNQTIEA